MQRGVNVANSLNMVINFHIFHLFQNGLTSRLYLMAS